MKAYLLLTLELSDEGSRNKLNDALKEAGWHKYENINTAWWKAHDTSGYIFSEKTAEAEALKTEAANLETMFTKLKIKSSVNSAIQAGIAKPIEV
ncbi:MAG: hypothetical protein IBX55_20910 [Methyloprofundus sp.]|nr:hypothetical protein [Methyloprofundus sp.]